jgi:hypothetical protein
MTNGLKHKNNTTIYSNPSVNVPYKKKFRLIIHSYEERREGDGEKIKHEENSQNCPFWTYILNKLAHPLSSA